MPGFCVNVAESSLLDLVGEGRRLGSRLLSIVGERAQVGRRRISRGSVYIDSDDANYGRSVDTIKL